MSQRCAHARRGPNFVIGRRVRQAAPERPLVPVVRHLALEVSIPSGRPVPCLSCQGEVLAEVESPDAPSFASQSRTGNGSSQHAQYVMFTCVCVYLFANGYRRESVCTMEEGSTDEAE